MVGDLALALVGLGADPAEFAENPAKFDIPDSVIGFLHLELGAFAVGHLAPRTQLGPGVVLRLSPLPFLELCLGGAMVVPSSEAIGGTAGSISAWSLGPSVGVGGGLTFGDLRVFLGGALVLERHLGSASSELFQRQQAGAWVVGRDRRFGRVISGSRGWRCRKRSAVTGAPGLPLNPRVHPLASPAAAAGRAGRGHSCAG